MSANMRIAGTGRETDEGYVGADFEAPDVPDYVVAELRYEAPVAFTASRFTAPAAAGPQADRLNDVLARFDIKRIRSQFGLRASTVRSRVDVAAVLPPEPNPARFVDRGMDTDFIHSGFVQVIPERGRDARRIAEALDRNDAVWKAHVAPRPVPAAVVNGSAAGSRDFEPAQGYLHAPPNGIGAAEVWSLPGAKGMGVTICDIEGNWNRSHEDLPTGIPLLGGTVIADLGWRNHGTAVLGEVVSIPDAKGTVGISHEAKGAVHSAVVNGVFNTAAAITNAAAALSAGDVILIELQGTGPNGKYVAMQYWSDIFSAVAGTGLQKDGERHHGGRGRGQREREFRARGVRGDWAPEGQRRDRRRRRDPADEPFRQRQRLRIDRRASVPDLVLEPRQDRERPRMGLARHHARLR